MAKEGDMSLFNDVLEPFRRVINTDPPKDKLSSATKLNFSDSNQSLKEGLNNLLTLGKRKSSLCMNDVCTPEKRVRSESSSTPASAPPSPWEAKRLKIDLIAAKAQITKLESRINHQHTIRKEMQILFEEEKGSLIEQHKRDERALSDMEDRLQLIRRREQELKDEYNQAIKEHKEQKANWDREKAELHKQIADMKDKLLECSVSSKDQLSEMKKDMDELLQALEGAQSEVEILKGEVAKQTTRAEQCTTLRTQLEKQTFELQSVTNKLKELEYERDSYKDWQQQAKTAQKRLSNMAELEKEVNRLRSQERSLRDAVCNKLLLEEQVHQLQSRVDVLQPVQNELHEAKVKLASVESALEEWKSAARTHGVDSARGLSGALDSALNCQLNATAASSQAHSQLAQLTEEVATIKFERDKATSKLNELQVVRKNQESLIHRLQKRLLLVTRERDSYSCLIETLRAESSKWREEAENLKRDVAKLRAQRDTLHANLERIGAQTQTKIKRLKASLREGGGSRACPEEMQQLKQQLESSRIKLKRLKEEFTSSAQEYRDVCYMLLGYKIDRTGHKNYRISNMYAESSEEYLTFTLDDDGIEMVHTDYSATLGELVELHLHQHRSIPLFLSALTMELFTRTTMQQVQ
ncbi:hypothetical protein HF086_006114 [Spodoptera exigua]|uniref:Mitotic spindle assembly checkpoint protein MAD1 n=1 Tax=Spodoptera exigua TaxID=7107 RepID=A0A922SNP4_SPOEX|nr:hypothetical protein HF086_006114 [Spodoptera exigua]